MTDGVQRVFGMEYRPIKDLEAMSPAGFKVSISRPVYILLKAVVFLLQIRR